MINVATIRIEMNKYENHQEEQTGLSDWETVIREKAKTKIAASSALNLGFKA